MISKLFKRGLLLALLVFVLSAEIALAFIYTSVLTITNSTSISYTQFPSIVSANVTYLAANNFINSTGNDTQVQSGSTNISSMLANDKILLSDVLAANSNQQYSFVTGQPQKSAFQIITGHGGYITTNDTAALEPSSNYSMSMNGYIDTTAGTNKYIVSKDNAIAVFVSPIVSGNITVSANGTYNQSTVNTTTNEADRYNTAPGVYTFNVNFNDSLVGNVAAGRYGEGIGIQYPINLPKGATVLNANLAITARASLGGVTVRSRITGEATDNASAFSDIANFNGRSHTTANVTWDSIQAFTDQTVYYSPDIKTVIQEIVNRPGWVSGNTITIFWEDFENRSTAGAYRQLYGNNGNQSKRPTLVISYTSSVSAVGISSGEHTLQVNSDGSNMWLTVDSSVSSNNTAVSINNTASNFIWNQNNVMPYINYIKESVGGTEKLWYQPNTIIQGTALPDRDGTKNGDITWGSNPSGISTTLGVLTPQSATVVTEPTTSQDIAPTIKINTGAYDPSNAIPVNPLSSIINFLATGNTTGVTGNPNGTGGNMYGIPPLVAWVLLAFVSSIGTYMGVFYFTRLGWLAGMFSAGVMGVFVAMHVIPLMFIIVSVILIVAGILERDR